MMPASLRIAFVTLVATSVFVSHNARADQTLKSKKAPACSTEFTVGYITLIQLMKNTMSYMKASQNSPVLAETAFACHRLLTNFPDAECLLPEADQTIKTSDLEKACGVIEQIFIYNGGSLDTGAVTDATPFGLLNPEAVRVTIRDGRAFQNLIDPPLAKFAVGGQILDLKQALESETSIRCAINRGVGSFLGIEGDKMQGNLSYEEFLSGVRAIHLTLANNALDLTCSKESAGHITLGDIKTAFGSILSIEYAP